MPAPRSLLCALALLACNEGKPATNGDSGTPPPAAAPTYSLEVLNRWPHDTGAFTQGLEIVEGTLYEGTGEYGRSTVRVADLASGTVRRRIDLPKEYFGEGITLLGGKLYQITWKEQRGFVYDPATLRQTGTFEYAGEGWGLTNNGRHLIMSDGSPRLRWIDPQTFRVTRTLDVTDQGLPVEELNELELIDGVLYANVWQTTVIARIDTTTGRVQSWLNAGDLLSPADRQRPVDVLNGIAWDRTNRRLFLTGKNWPAMFEVRVREGN
jgi:glutaminyl-peptide cyclotransferase